MKRMLWIAGPCVIESEALCVQVAARCQELAERYGADYIFKASFDKANRTAKDSFRGPGLEKGLRVLQNIKTKFGVRVTTDVHESAQVAPVAEVVDVIQIPAFLCRQTDLIAAAGRSGKIVNIKKGQFMDPANMGYAVEKARSANAQAEVWLTERGTSFGYGRFIVDFCGFRTLSAFGTPIIMDATHAVQRPGGGGAQTGGAPECVEDLGAAAIVCGAAGIFTETHPEPSKALSDAANTLSFDLTQQCLERWTRLWNFRNTKD